MKKKDLQTIFIDKDGRTWNSINLQELIDACKSFEEFKDFLNFYF